MKKRLVLKKWVENIILVIMALALIIIGSECDKMSAFLITHAIALIIFVASAFIINRYGRDYE